MLTTERLKELFDYHPYGYLIRTIALSNVSKIGEKIGFHRKNSYFAASVEGKTYYIHNLICVWHGNSSDDRLDHINNDRSDNRIENLRIATHSQNMWNKRLQKNNTSGVKGVTWRPSKNAYSVRIGVNKKRLHFGYFKDIELAELVAKEARDKYHGQFANTGKKED